MKSKRMVYLAMPLMLATTSLLAQHHDGGNRGDVGNRGGSVHSDGGFHGGGSFGGRDFHGSVRHEAPRVEHREVRPEIHGQINSPRHNIYVHRDVDVHFDHPRHWDFRYGYRVPRLPGGFLSLSIGGAPYYYS